MNLHLTPCPTPGFDKCRSDVIDVDKNFHLSKSREFNELNIHTKINFPRLDGGAIFFNQSVSCEGYTHRLQERVG